MLWDRVERVSVSRYVLDKYITVAIVDWLLTSRRSTRSCIRFII
jgi:hypothetical protein